MRKLYANVIVYGVPILILLYVLYMNFLPFGYAKTFTLDVGSAGDTDDSTVLYLKPSKALGAPEVYANGTTFRRLNGTVEVGFNPKVVLRDATINVTVIGSDVFVGGPIEFDAAAIDWDYSWDFSEDIPSDLKGDAYWKEDCGAYFNGSTSLYLPNSSDMFEDGPFMVYASWTPMNSEDSFQQIVGHYNWEVFQDQKDVGFQIGRMDDAGGSFHGFKKEINNSKNTDSISLLAIYNPSGNGYVELFTNNHFVGRTYFGNSSIWQNYSDLPLTFGKSSHSLSHHYQGCLKKVGITLVPLRLVVPHASFDPNTHREIIVGYGDLNKVTMNLEI